MLYFTTQMTEKYSTAMCYMGPGNERAITLARLKSLIPTDKDYADLIRNLEEKLPWGETCKEYRQQKKHISVCDGVALYNDRVIIP